MIKNSTLDVLILIMLSVACAPVSAQIPTATEAIATSSPTSSPTPTSTLTPTPVATPTPPIVVQGEVVGQNDQAPFQILASFSGPGLDDLGHVNCELDYDIAVGTTAILAVSNCGVGLFTKDSTLLGFADNSDFFAPALTKHRPGMTMGVGEVRTVYDFNSERFFFVAAAKQSSEDWAPCTPETCISDFVLAVSRSPNPQTLTEEDWFFYLFDGLLYGHDDLNRVVDFTEISVNDNAVILTSQNALDYYVPNAQGGIAKILLLPKDELLNGFQPSEWNTLFGIPNPLYAAPYIDELEPVILLDPTDTAFFLYWNGSICSIAVIGVDDVLGEPEITTQIAKAPGRCEFPANSPQPGNTVSLRSVASPLGSRPVLQNGTIWGTAVVRAPGAPGSHGAIRWYQIDLSEWPESVSFIQDAVYSHPKLSLIYPSIMVSEEGNVLIHYLGTGEEMYPSLFATGRLTADIPNTLRPSLILKLSQASWEQSMLFRPDHFVDYIGAALDPVDQTVWTFGEYFYSTCGWDTWIAHFAWEELSIEDYEILSLDQIFKQHQACRLSISGEVVGLPETEGEYDIAACPLEMGIVGRCLGFPIYSDFTFRFVLSAGTYILSLNDPDGAIGWYTENGLDPTGNCATELTISEISTFVLELDAGVFIECDK